MREKHRAAAIWDAARGRCGMLGYTLIKASHYGNKGGSVRI